MTRHRTIILIVGSLAAFAGASSDAALASSLLSGYGGPGQGNQALLGSAMLNGGGGGGSTGAAASAGELYAGDRRSSERRRSAHDEQWPSCSLAAATPDRRRTRSQAHPVQGAADSSHAHLRRLPGGRTRRARRHRAACWGSPAADVLLIVLVLCALGFTGVLTRRLTRASPAGTQR